MPSQNHLMRLLANKAQILGLTEETKGKGVDVDSKQQEGRSTQSKPNHEDKTPIDLTDLLVTSEINLGVFHFDFISFPSTFNDLSLLTLVALLIGSISDNVVPLFPLSQSRQTTTCPFKVRDDVYVHEPCRGIADPVLFAS
ncbi:hypothetical protein BU17DRAFT_102776 [Hysterangium stoloniferum]|nr:hypothetical protein BU17DRAFT_102776 [Hysterangium stoloniferum]